MNGLLLLDKPAGISSTQAIRQIQKKFGLKKIGHGGTLDPFATGLLIVLIGEATKISRFLLHGEKTYEACAAIGWETNTGDREGTPRSALAAAPVEETAWKAALPQFVGKIQQVPPQFSAIKVKGQPLYKYARREETVAIASRAVDIHALEISRFSPQLVRFRVRCGGGTYIRTLAEDWARAAGTCAHLRELRRLSVGSFGVETSNPLADLLAPTCTALPELVSITEALHFLPQLQCTASAAEKIARGHQESLSAFLRENLREADAAAAYILLTTAHGNKTQAFALLAKNPVGCSALQAPFTLERVLAPSTAP